MNRRLFLALAAVALLASTSGCLGLFGSNDLPADRIDSEPPVEGGYAWESNATAHIEILESTKFAAVYQLNRSEIELYRRDGFGGRNPLSVEAVRYRYPNGTVINGTEIRQRGGAVRQNRDVTTVVLPNGTDGGQLAFTGSGSQKRFSLPTYVKGSYEIVLPPNRSIDAPVIGQARPNGYEKTVENGQVHLRWAAEDIGQNVDTVSVQFYLERDLYVFGGLFALFALVGGGGLLYYRRKIEALRKQREEMGLNVKTDDEFDDGPPPGMR